MATSADAFWAVVNISRMLSDRQRQLRTTPVDIQRNFRGQLPISPLQGDLPGVQRAIRDFGKATLDILAVIKAAYDDHPAELQAAAVAPLPLFADLQDQYVLLHTWATNLNTATITTEAQLDNGVAAVLANVPAAMLPF